jgi:hypothetical protein
MKQQLLRRARVHAFALPRVEAGIPESPHGALSPREIEPDLFGDLAKRFAVIWTNQFEKDHYVLRLQHVDNVSCFDT